MLNDLQRYVSVFAHLTVVCTFGLSMVIAVAGASQVAVPFGVQKGPSQSLAVLAVLKTG
jgi:hypothetical protein